MEREVGGGIGMGNTFKPMAVSFQCMTKFTKNKKKKKIKMVGFMLHLFYHPEKNFDSAILLNHIENLYGKKPEGDE